MSAATAPVLRRVLLIVGVLLVVGGCRMDIALDIDVEPDGTGTITLQLDVDAEVVERVPTVADELALDDVVAAGWVVDGPTPNDEGGLRLVLTHRFESDREATNLLRSLGGPFKDMEMQRTTTGDEVTTQVGGRIGLTEGFDTFADDELIEVVGGFPFTDEITESGATPVDAFGIVVRADLPGEVIAEATNADGRDDGALVWTVPTDGSVLQWLGAARQAPEEGAPWARPVAIAALVALIAWLAFMAGSDRARRDRSVAPRPSAPAPPRALAPGSISGGAWTRSDEHRLRRARVLRP